VGVNTDHVGKPLLMDSSIVISRKCKIHFQTPLLIAQLKVRVLASMSFTLEELLHIGIVRIAYTSFISHLSMHIL
jgi:hypothetical protein